MSDDGYALVYIYIYIWDVSGKIYGSPGDKNLTSADVCPDEIRRISPGGVALRPQALRPSTPKIFSAKRRVCGLETFRSTPNNKVSANASVSVCVYFIKCVF